MRIITIANDKGGIGKTTISANLALALTHQKKRVGLIDFCPQANLSMCFDYTPVTHLEQVLEQKSLSIKHFTPVADNLFLLPNNKTITNDFFFKFSPIQQANLLKIALRDFEPESLDYLIIDTPKGLEYQNYNSLLVSDYVLIPTVLEPFSITAIHQILDSIDQVQDPVLNPDLKILGVIINQFDRRFGSDNIRYIRDIKTLVDQNKILNTKIRTNSKIKTGQNESRLLDKNNQKGLEDFTSLATEIINLTK